MLVDTDDSFDLPTILEMDEPAEVLWERLIGRGVTGNRLIRVLDEVGRLDTLPGMTEILEAHALVFLSSPEDFCPMVAIKRGEGMAAGLYRTCLPAPLTHAAAYELLRCTAMALEPRIMCACF